MKKFKRPDMRYAKSKTVYHRTNKLDEIIVDTLYDKIKNLQQSNKLHSSVACKLVEPLMKVLPDKIVDDILNGKYTPKATVAEGIGFDIRTKRAGWWVEIDAFELEDLRRKEDEKDIRY